MLPKDDSSAGHRFPTFLPDGVHFLYNSAGVKRDSGGLFAGALDSTGSVRLLSDRTNAQYVSSDLAGGDGRLLFRREETLVWQAFDPATLTLKGEAFPIAEEVPISVNIGYGAFSASASTLVYRTGSSAGSRELAWVDRGGRRIGSATKPAALYLFPAISPSERTVAISIRTGEQADIWLQDLDRDVISRFTFGPTLDRNARWSPDGSRLAFSSQSLGGGAVDLFEKSANGNAQEELLVHAGVNAFVRDWSSDGKWLVYAEQGQTTSLDLWLLPLDGDRKPQLYLQTPFSETNARFAPGGDSPPRWMAYESNESGQNQIYIQAIPGSGAKYQVSISGGASPAWRRDGKELFYLSTDQKVIAVPITLGAGVEIGTPQELFASPGVTGYDVSADGKRFLLNVPAGGAEAVPPVTVVLNWTAGLAK